MMLECFMLECFTASIYKSTWGGNQNGTFGREITLKTFPPPFQQNIFNMFSLSSRLYYKHKTQDWPDWLQTK